MAGVLLELGQEHILDVLFEATAVQNYHLALIESTSNPTLGQQIGSGIIEVTGTGYARILLTRATDWSRSGQIVTALQKTFTVGSGGWDDVNGYAICLSATPTTGDAIMAESFTAGQQGNKNENDTIKVTANYEQKDNSE